MKSDLAFSIVAAAAVTMMITIAEPAMAKPQDNAVLLDDFSSTDGRSTLGPSWQGFTDRVMGGLSDIRAGYIETDRGPAVRMQGTVRLDNNGGFVQLRLPLVVDDRPMDASQMDGFVIEARGKPGPYYLHLRTTDTRRPWAYYRAKLEITEDWTTIGIPLADFERVSTRTALDTSRLMSVGLVAYGEEFDAELDVRYLALSSDLKDAAGSSGNDTGADR